MTRILVAGLGNIFLGDDGFGVEVAQRLAAWPFPGDVRVMDIGIRGIDLAYELASGYDAAILIDLARRGGAPGTLYVIDPAVEPNARSSVDAHALDPATVLELVGPEAAPHCLRLVACEPDSLERPGLSAAVEAAIEPAARLVSELVDQILAEGPGGGDA